MKHIAVLGAGEAGVNFVDQIQGKTSGFSLTLIDRDSRYWDKQAFLTNLSFKEWRDLPEWCKDEGINFICDSVERVNINRRKIYFKEAETIDFDLLVVATGLRSKTVTAKGEHREGVVYLSKMDPFKVSDLFKISPEIIVYVTTFLGIRLALTLQAAGKEVRVLTQSLEFLELYKERVIKHLEERNIPVHSGVSIEEFIGEGQIRATKINPLKVFSSQLVFIDSGFTRSIDFFEDPFTIQGVVETNHDNVFVIGEANRLDIESEFFFLTGHHNAQVQARALATALLEGNKPIIERVSMSSVERQRVLEELIAPKVNSVE